MPERELHHHLGIPKNEISFAPVCLNTGAKGRTWVIGNQLEHVRWWGLHEKQESPEHERGHLSCTGEYEGKEISCFSTGIGGPTFFTTIREAVEGGARVLIRVGSGGAISPDIKIGQVVIGKGAYLWDGASALVLPDEARRSALLALAGEEYFNPSLKLASNMQIANALVSAAGEIAPDDYFVGTEFSTADFWTEQRRLNLFGKIPPHIEARYRQAENIENSYFSMELGPGLAWCIGEGGGLPMGAITTMYAQRAVSEKAQHADDALAIEIALHAAASLYDEPVMQKYISREIPSYV